MSGSGWSLPSRYMIRGVWGVATKRWHHFTQKPGGSFWTACDKYRLDSPPPDLTDRFDDSIAPVCVKCAEARVEASLEPTRREEEDAETTREIDQQLSGRWEK